jgi:hypothetical protein
MEASFFAGALIAAEVILLLRAPEKWSDDPLAQQLLVHERAARGQGIAYDARLPTEVVRDLQAKGLDAVPGFAASNVANPSVANAIRERGLLPLSNVANALVVECNEGTGYLQFRSDQFGFNNPPGLAAGPIDVAIVGESLALGHCVAPSTSAVDRVRAQFPRTANPPTEESVVPARRLRIRGAAGAIGRRLLQQRTRGAPARERARADALPARRAVFAGLRQRQWRRLVRSRRTVPRQQRDRELRDELGDS